MQPMLKRVPDQHQREEMNMSAHIIGSGRLQGWRRPLTAAATALTLLSGLVFTVAVAAAAQAATTPLGHIYWANASGNTIGRADLDGTDVDQSFISGASGPSDVLVDGQYIYWGNATGCTEDGACDGSIGRAHLDGTELATGDGCGDLDVARQADAELTVPAGGAAVYADDAAALVQAMRQAVERPEWVAERSALSLERAREFSWERTARLTREVYLEARRRFGS